MLANAPSGARQGVSLSRNVIILAGTLTALVVVVALVGMALSILSEPDDATEVVQRASNASGTPGYPSCAEVTTLYRLYP
jgi:hypothetical protein